MPCAAGGGVFTYDVIWSVFVRLMQASRAFGRVVRRWTTLMPMWKTFLVQLLNIAGLGPAPISCWARPRSRGVSLDHVLGIFMGAAHDFIAGMISPAQ